MLLGADRGIVYDWTCVGGLTLGGIAAALLSTRSPAGKFLTFRTPYPSPHPPPVFDPHYGILELVKFVRLWRAILCLSRCNSVFFM
jgi:hypothetical protein